MIPSTITTMELFFTDSLFPAATTQSKGKTICGHPTNNTSRQSQHQTAVFTSHNNNSFSSSHTGREQELSLSLLHILLLPSTPIVYNPYFIKSAHRTQYCLLPLIDSHISFSHSHIHPPINTQREKTNNHYHSKISAHIMNKISHCYPLHTIIPLIRFSFPIHRFSL